MPARGENEKGSSYTQCRPLCSTVESILFVVLCSLLYVHMHGYEKQHGYEKAATMNK